MTTQTIEDLEAAMTSIESALKEAASDPRLCQGPTPCSEWTVAELVHHLFSDLDNFALMARGEKPEWGRQAAGVAPADWAVRWGEGSGELAQAWRTQTEADSPLTGMPVVELAVHSWDLHRALGRSLALDSGLVERALEFGRANLKPEYRGEGKGFGEQVEVASGAPAIDRLAGFYGRDPSWQPPAA